MQFDSEGIVRTKQSSLGVHGNVANVYTFKKYMFILKQQQHVVTHIYNQHFNVFTLLFYATIHIFYNYCTYTVQ